MQNDLIFEFAILDLRRPENNQYRVKLKQDDEKWRQLGNKPVVNYPSLSPGEYRFQVQGANSLGNWNMQAPAIDFKISPPWWKRSSVHIGIGLVVLIFVATFFKYRIRQLKKFEKARKRIADDLHDDIGAKMSSVGLQVEILRNSMKLSPDEEIQMDDIAETAREVVVAVQDDIWLVDSVNDNLDALVDRMRQTANRILLNTSMRFHKTENIPAIPLKLEHRRFMLLIFQEMLHNVMKHAQASQVDIQISYKDYIFSMEVHDDGVGFDPDKNKRGRGLTTLKERSVQLKGKLDISSEIGKGTRQHFSVKIRPKNRTFPGG